MVISLLPPAAFAVLLSYIIQSQLSAHLKYSSLYEAQVEGRAQSPSRYVENVELALRLLGTRQIPRTAKVGHLDLVALLDSRNTHTAARPEAIACGGSATREHSHWKDRPSLL